jgi:mannose-1-phosphate guanylyltransferase
MRVVVIMAGGSGERFWPLSRKLRPKQVLALTGDRSMLEETVDRAARVVERRHVHIVAGPALMPSLRALLPDLPAENFLTEPMARNTAPCLAFAAAVLARRYGPETTMGVITADHLIEDLDTFARNISLAFEYAEAAPRLVVVGIRPAYPNTGFGYVEFGPVARENAEGRVYEVEGFREKPDQATAERYVASGHHYWNSGMFYWRISTLLAAFEAYTPELAAGARRIGEAFGTPGYEDVVRQVFEGWPSISIDYAVMEKAANVAGVAAEFDWDDIGTWTALARSHPVDDHGNFVSGRALLVETENSIVFNGADAPAAGPSERRRPPLVATLGVKDLIVVATADAVLVCPRDREQDVKRLLAALREQGHTEYL